MKRNILYMLILIVALLGVIAWLHWPPLLVQNEKANPAKLAELHFASSNAPAVIDKVGRDSSPPEAEVIQQQPMPVVKPTANSSAAPTAAPSPIRFAEGPPNGAELILAEAHELLHTDSPTLEAEPPLAKYTLRASGGLDTAQPAGFFYILEDSGNLAAGADIIDPNGTGAYRFRSLGGAPEFAGADAIASALEKMTTLQELQGGAYEARLLTIPRPRLNQGLTFSVLWLKSDPGGTDFIYTLPSSNPSTPLPFGLREGKLYPVDVFIELIRPPLIPPAAPPNQ